MLYVAYVEKESRLFQLLSESEGKDSVVIYIENPKAKKELPKNRNVCADKNLLELLSKEFGEENLRVTV